ncbi:hypothetical protein GIB67_042039 [Kingdonia uniflora]|uniref:Uncharacterized protein n=1 Tax=Kingdonia uniflora TaxID=39325 RepID=A0A7J7MW91_9MAGN|nr:hypothetical protein GIB67_042039 [Kingdonia uniflora]
MESGETTLRISTNKAIATNDGKPLPLYQKALCGLTAGAIGASVGSPADLALIRMQADATLPLTHRKNYKNAFHYLARIFADEGVTALWKGAGPTVVRAITLNMGMLASYDQSVELFKDQLGFGEASTVGQVLFQDSLLQFAVYHLIMSRPRFRKCNLMQPESNQIQESTITIEILAIIEDILASSLAFFMVLIISLVMGIVLNYIMFLCTIINSVLTTTIVGVLKGVGSTTLGFVLLGGVQALNLTGLIINTTGGLWYSYAKFQQRRSNGRYCLTLKLIINRTK